MRRRYEGLAKLATVSAVIFGVSLGLCGVTALGSSIYQLADSLFYVGLFELLGAAVGLFGLFGVGIMALAEWIGSLGKKNEEAE